MSNDNDMVVDKIVERLKSIQYETDIEVLKERIDSIIEDYSSCYCPVCGSCGESGCCSPDMCKSVVLEKSIDEVMKGGYFETLDDFIEKLKKYHSEGYYCDWNVKSYKQQELNLNVFYNALKQIKESTKEIETYRICENAYKEVYGEYDEDTY